MSRIKVMSNLNIAEKRLPQDGSMRVNVAQREVDVRVSVLPTAHGERIVMRLLDKEEQLTRIDQLGLAQPQRVWMDQCLSRTHGIILVTGPTGSGKSTSLYAALNAINTADKNIITIEDPIEYTLSGVGQIQVSPKIGLTFAGGLRSILRQDPDVIMVGEIRDLETAEIAVQASLTGHLVLSTLHTNDSVGAVARLSDMGVEPFLLSASLEGVVAQRLVRRLCNHCKEPYDPGEIAEVESTHYCRPKGCDHCLDTGYRGRTAIFEMLTINDEIRELITRPESTEQELRRAAERGGMFSLRQAGWQKAAEGVTSIEEVYRVTQESV
jgi:general secretion pathway protein E